MISGGASLMQLEPSGSTCVNHAALDGGHDAPVENNVVDVAFPSVSNKRGEVAEVCLCCSESPRFEYWSNGS